MAMSGKERQRKWQERQKAVGKKRVTILLDKDALTVLEQEKARTGKNLSQIICEAVMHIRKKVSDNEVAEIGRSPDRSVSDNELAERIVTLIGVVGLSEKEVAERFIDEKTAPPSDGETWSAEVVRTLYERAISF